MNFSIYFDGTRNSKDNDAPEGRHTNVARLYDYDQSTGTNLSRNSGFPKKEYGEEAIPAGQSEKIYFDGVNSQASDWGKRANFVEGAFGVGGRVRVDEAYSAIVSYYNKNAGREINLNLVGFSRGASQARALANVFIENGVPRTGPDGNPLRGADGQIDYLVRPGEGSVRNLGIFDTVASYDPAFETHNGFDLRVHPNVQNCFHPVAEHEYRKTFPLTSALGTDHDDRIKEVRYPGCHGQCGGGYPGDILSAAPLENMRQELSANGMRFSELNAQDRARLDQYHAIKDKPEEIQKHLLDSRINKADEAFRNPEPGGLPRYEQKTFIGEKGWAFSSGAQKHHFEHEVNGRKVIFEQDNSRGDYGAFAKQKLNDLSAGVRDKYHTFMDAATNKLEAFAGKIRGTDNSEGFEDKGSLAKELKDRKAGLEQRAEQAGKLSPQAREMQTAMQNSRPVVTRPAPEVRTSNTGQRMNEYQEAKAADPPRTAPDPNDLSGGRPQAEKGVPAAEGPDQNAAAPGSRDLTGKLARADADKAATAIPKEQRGVQPQAASLGSQSGADAAGNDLASTGHKTAESRRENVPLPPEQAAELRKTNPDPVARSHAAGSDTRQSEGSAAVVNKEAASNRIQQMREKHNEAKGSANAAAQSRDDSNKRQADASPAITDKESTTKRIQEIREKSLPDSARPAPAPRPGGGTQTITKGTPGLDPGYADKSVHDPRGMTDKAAKFEGNAKAQAPAAASPDGAAAARNHPASTEDKRVDSRHDNARQQPEQTRPALQKTSPDPVARSGDDGQGKRQPAMHGGSPREGGDHPRPAASSGERARSAQTVSAVRKEALEPQADAKVGGTAQGGPAADPVREAPGATRDTAVTASPTQPASGTSAQPPGQTPASRTSGPPPVRPGSTQSVPPDHGAGKAATGPQRTSTGQAPVPPPVRPGSVPAGGPGGQAPGHGAPPPAGQGKPPQTPPPARNPNPPPAGQGPGKSGIDL